MKKISARVTESALNYFCYTTLMSHPAETLDNNYPLVYTATSKEYFAFRMFISKFVLEERAVPLNPFMVFDYFMLDTVERDVVREANNNLVKRSDEIWCFGSISDGVRVEIDLAEKEGKKVRYFKIEKPANFTEVSQSDLIEHD